MAKWLGIELNSRDYFRDETSRQKLILLQAVRLGFFAIILLITLVFQIRQRDFVSTEVLFPLYGMLSGVFFINIVYTYNLQKFTHKLGMITASLFAIDAFFITGLIHYTGYNQSIFLFMYLINIILCGLVFQKFGALMLALLTSVCFSFLTVIGPELAGATLYFTVGVNNLAFVSVALLSGYLSEQLNFMGSAIEERDEDIRVLQSFNEVIVNNIAAGLMTVDRSGVIQHSNPAAKRILGTKLDLNRRPLTELVPEVWNRVKSAEFSSGHALERFEVLYLSPKEDRLLLGCSVSPILEVNGDSKGFILIFQDLTEIKRLERVIQRSEKLAAVGQLAAGIAHEIRNPLASISGSIQLLSRSINSSSSEDQKLMSIMLKEIDRLNHLITEFLDFVRPEQLVEKVIDVNAMLSEVLDMVRVNTKLRTDVEQVKDLKSQRKVLGNPDKLKQVFLNLVINSYQAMEKTNNPRITVKTTVERGLLKVSIRDSGIGMNDSVSKRLFEPFFTTKTGGTGLGLATSHKILESHEARVHVESKEGIGTEFLIEFTKLAPVEELVDNKAISIKRG